MSTPAARRPSGARPAAEPAAKPARKAAPQDKPGPAKAAPKAIAPVRAGRKAALKAAPMAASRADQPTPPQTGAVKLAPAKAGVKPTNRQAANAKVSTGKPTGKIAETKSRRPSASPTGVARARRPRVPANFAAQYGEGTKPHKAKRRAPGGAPTERRTRRDAVARERLRQIMTPDDDLLRRLLCAGAIAASSVETNGATGGGRGARSQTARRPRRWESRCGKCGMAAVFKAAAGVCARCGAIAVRMMSDER